MKIFGIVILVLILAAAGVYFFLYRKPSKTAPDETINTNANPANSGSALPSIGGGTAVSLSTLVNSSDVIAASFPSTYFDYVTDQNLTSHNIFTSQLSAVPSSIHYTSAFNNTNSCSQYIWYKKFLYVLVNTNTDNQGNKTCYYKLDKSVLPGNLKVQSTSTPANCLAYVYYLSGVQYKFHKATTENGLTGTKHYCNYAKQ